MHSEKGANKKPTISLPICKDSKDSNFLLYTQQQQFCMTENKSYIGGNDSCFIVTKDSLSTLINSTSKLLNILKQIQEKRKLFCGLLTSKASEKPAINSNATDECVQTHFTPDYEDLRALKQIATLSHEIYEVNKEMLPDDDCSVFKKLARICVCLNNEISNDIVIHFNEDSKYNSNTSGEIIKNMRILKKFLYMGSNYTKNALLFLNEGMIESNFVEKLEIVNACAFADLCNVFSDDSIVTFCIKYPIMHPKLADYYVQNLAAKFLKSLAQLEEGRRYLKLNSKITNELKQLLKRNSPVLTNDVLNDLTTTIELLNPLNVKVYDVMYDYRPEEAMTKRALNSLMKNKNCLILEDVHVHLDLLHSLSLQKQGIAELISWMPSLLSVVQCIVQIYNDRYVNATVAKIILNLFSDDNQLDFTGSKSESLTNEKFYQYYMRKLFSKTICTQTKYR